MNDEQAATAVYQTIQTAKKHVGAEKCIGMVMGAVIGEVMLSGGTREQLVKLCEDTWLAFEKARDERAGA